MDLMPPTKAVGCRGGSQTYGGALGWWDRSSWLMGGWCWRLCSLSHFLFVCSTDVQKYSHLPYTQGLLLSWPGRKQVLEKAQLVNWGVKGEIWHLFSLSALSSIMVLFTESSNTIIIPPWSQQEINESPSDFRNENCFLQFGDSLCCFHSSWNLNTQKLLPKLG